MSVLATQATDDDLDAEQRLDQTIRMLARVGYELYSSHIVGVSCGSLDRRIRRMQNPQVGDIVVETSTSGFWRLPGRQAPFEYIQAENAVGVLEKVTREFYDKDEDWDEEREGMPRPTQKVWYLKLLDDGRIFRWTNADCVTILPVEGWVW